METKTGTGMETDWALVLVLALDCYSPQQLRREAA
jgi:hypothetical protein